MRRPDAASVSTGRRRPECHFGGRRFEHQFARVDDGDGDLAAHQVMRSAKQRHRAIPTTLLRDANHTVPPHRSPAPPG